MCDPVHCNLLSSLNCRSFDFHNFGHLSSRVGSEEVGRPAHIKDVYVFYTPRGYKKKHVCVISNNVCMRTVYIFFNI